ncbi:hypothetical protein [Streptomyces sp. NPDC006510]|uniref:hypothetical protein n=1 Tax=Streptomyces sp. NPDC006510 TaxID=3155600 RepID=UPI0033B43C5B
MIFIAATMFTAGLGATLPALRSVFADIPLPALALLANLVIIPLLGRGIGALFGLSSASFIALVQGALAAVLLSGPAAALPIATVLSGRRSGPPETGRTH